MEQQATAGESFTSFDSVSLFLDVRCKPAWTSQSLKLALPRAAESMHDQL